MSKDKYYQLVVSINEDVAAKLLISFLGKNIEDSLKKIVTNIQFEATITSIKKGIFPQHMMNYVNKIQLSDQQYQTNWNVRVVNYNGKFLFPTK